MVAKQTEGKEYLIDTLRKEGYFVNAMGGNFVFVKTKKDAADVTDRLKNEEKILVKHYTDEKYKNYIRVTTGTKDIMEKFVASLQKCDK